MPDYCIGGVPSVSLILLYGEKKGKPYTGPFGDVVKYRVQARNASEVYKTMSTAYYGDPYIHPNSFERACEEIQVLRDQQQNTLYHERLATIREGSN